MNENAEKKQLLPWIIIGVLVVVLIGGGIYVYRDLHQSQSAAATTGQNTNRTNRGGQNPAMRAAMSLLRLQQNQDPKLALTADQKAKLIPIVQELKDTANPSQQFSQDKATAIEQVLTDDQKTFLNQRPNGQGGQWNGQPGSGQGQWGGNRQPGSAQGQDGSQRPQGTGNGQFNASDLYDRVLKALQ